MKFKTKKHLPIILLLIVVTLLGILLVAYEQAKTPQSKQSQNTNEAQEPIIVRLEQSGFNPASVTVKKGTRIIWINNTANIATVNSDNHPSHTLSPFLNLGSFEQGSTVQTIFEKEGTYGYHNHLIPAQKGTIIVK